jgi:hypothetical protein
MSVNAPIASADCRTKREVIRTDGFVTFIRFTVRAREGIATLPLGGRWGTGVSRTLILLGLIRWWLVSYGDGAARSGRGACRATPAPALQPSGSITSARSSAGASLNAKWTWDPWSGARAILPISTLLPISLRLD